MNKLKTFMIFICPNASFIPPETIEPEVLNWISETKNKGAYIQGNRFRPILESKSVSVANEKVSIIDTPKETAEGIGGYDLIQCKNLEEALEIASKHPMAKHGVIQVREIWEDW